MAPTIVSFNKALLRQYCHLQGWKLRACVEPIIFFALVCGLEYALHLQELVLATLAPAAAFVILHLLKMWTIKLGTIFSMRENGITFGTQLTISFLEDGLHLVAKKPDASSFEKTYPYSSITTIQTGKSYFYLSAMNKMFFVVAKNIPSENSSPEKIKQFLEKMFPHAEWI